MKALTHGGEDTGELKEENYQEKFTELMQMRLSELKDIARAFPRDRAFGGWSGKTKTNLIVWILSRRGVKQ